MQDHNEYIKQLDALYALEFSGMKLGLHNTHELLQYLGNPHHNLRVIHVAGTNGKGSVSAMIAAALQANGLSTGLYTSPHLVNFTERVKIDGVEMPQDYLIRYMKETTKKVAEISATFFEVTSCMMFKYFKEQNVDIAVIETGMGGRLDSTNVVRSPLACVITSIGLDHTKHLGDTTEQIALEKAGIMKQNTPAIVNVSDESLRHVFRNRAYDVKCPLYFTDEEDIDVTYTPPFLGEHQKTNLKSSLLALQYSGLQLSDEEIKNGIENTIKLTGLRARLEKLEVNGRRLILDVGHNPPAFETINRYFKEQKIKPIIVAGFAKDKDVAAILRIIRTFADRFIAVAADNHRAMNADELALLANELGFEAESSRNVIDGVNKAFAMSSDKVILLTGSHYVVGEYLASQKT